MIHVALIVCPLPHCPSNAVTTSAALNIHSAGKFIKLLSSPWTTVSSSIEMCMTMNEELTDWFSNLSLYEQYLQTLESFAAVAGRIQHTKIDAIKNRALVAVKRCAPAVPTIATDRTILWKHHWEWHLHWFLSLSSRWSEQNRAIRVVKTNNK